MRLLLATMSHETNTFSPVPTKLARFCRDGTTLLKGQAAIDFYRDTGTRMGGYLAIAEAEAALRAHDARGDRKLHELLAEATRHAVSRWAEADALAFNVVRAEERANSVTTVLVQGREPSVISDYCREKCGVVLGRGIGDLQGRAFRIAHMGYVNAPMVFGVLGAIEMALGALRIPHGRGGLQAAVEYLGREVRP